MASRLARRSRRTTPGSAASTLLMTTISGTARHRRRASTSRTAASWPSGSGCEPSTTCRTRSASATSSSVERNASTSWCGRCRTKPTVSVSVNSRPSGGLGAAHRRVERGEQRVLDEDAGAGQPVEQRWTCPRWCSRRWRRDGIALRRRGAALGDADRLHVRDLAAQLGHPGADPPPVELDLRLTGTARADAGAAGHPATGLPGHRLTPAAQAREQVLQLRQLDLRLALLALGVLGEDVEDQRGAVDDLDLDDVLQRAALGRASSPSQIDGVGADGRDDAAQVLRLARAEEGAGSGFCRRCRSAVEHLRPGGLGERGELAQGVLGVRRRCRRPRRRPARRAPGAAAGTRPR